jgi:uncharacterized protein
MKPLFFASLLAFSGLTCLAQTNKAYHDSLQAFRANYINTHEVVKTNEDRMLLQFFPLDPSYRVTCRFEKLTGSEWFPMATSGAATQMHRKYGRLTFSIHDTTFHLFVYQSQSLLTVKGYEGYLFVPFTDITSGETTYGAGRYLDCDINDIQGETMRLDFNKAYNPYCAYTAGYNCPIPPKENDLQVAILAGEKNYGKKIH